VGLEKGQHPGNAGEFPHEHLLEVVLLPAVLQPGPAVQVVKGLQQLVARVAFLRRVAIQQADGTVDVLAGEGRIDESRNATVAIADADAVAIAVAVADAVVASSTRSISTTAGLGFGAAATQIKRRRRRDSLFFFFFVVGVVVINVIVGIIVIVIGVVIVAVVFLVAVARDNVRTRVSGIRIGGGDALLLGGLWRCCCCCCSLRRAFVGQHKDATGRSRHRI